MTLLRDWRMRMQNFRMSDWYDQKIEIIFSGDSRAIMQLGLLLLIATPIVRVMFSIFAFAIEGDRMYVLFTLIVLTVLLYSLFGSFLIA